MSHKMIDQACLSLGADTPPAFGSLGVTHSPQFTAEIQKGFYD